MAKRPRIFLGNIPFSATEDDIRQFFGDYTLTDVKIVADRDTGRSRGFAFVELENFDDMQSAITNLDGAEMGGRELVVNEAREREDRGGSGGSGGQRHDRDSPRGGKRGRRDKSW